jgi:flavin-dependent dehydrogenase
MFDPSHPREKPCGGGVTARALALLAGADLELPARVNVRRARFIDSASGDSVPVSLTDRATLSVASRAQFDQSLVSAACRAGARLVAARVRSIARDRGGWRVEPDGASPYTARFLVGADGAGGIVRRCVSRPFRREQLSIATGFYAQGVTSDEIVLEFTADPPGYIWSFPRPDHLAVGICVQADAGVGPEALRARTARWIENAGIARGARLERYAWPIPSLSVRDFAVLDLAGPGWLLTGDAAGLVDPITREGIFYALQSAAFAANAVGSEAGGGERRYQEEVRGEIVGELARAARIKDAFFRPRFIRLMLDALQSSEPVRDVMADLVAGAQPYRGLRWRLARTFEFSLALKALRLV